MFITIVINSLMLSLCDIYASNNQVEQLEFLQELNNCLIDKSELTTLIVGGDWNCALSKNDKIGGKPWKATNCQRVRPSGRPEGLTRRQIIEPREDMYTRKKSQKRSKV